MLPHQISLTSQSGAGSSSTMNALKQLLTAPAWRWMSGGDLMRKYAASKGMSIEELADRARRYPEERHDFWLDQMTQEEAATDWMVCEARLAHYNMPHAFHVYQYCDLETRALRRHRQNPDKYPTVDVARRAIAERDQDDRERYTKLYEGCLWTLDRYDLVVDSTLLSTEEIALEIVAKHTEWAARHKLTF